MLSSGQKLCLCKKPLCHNWLGAVLQCQREVYNKQENHACLLIVLDQICRRKKRLINWSSIRIFIETDVLFDVHVVSYLINLNFADVKMPILLCKLKVAYYELRERLPF